MEMAWVKFGRRLFQVRRLLLCFVPLFILWICQRYVLFLKKTKSQRVQVVIYTHGKNPEEQFDFANTVIKDKSNIFIVYENVTMSMEFRLRHFFDKFFGIKEQTILARWIYRWLVAHDLMDINAKILIENSSVFLRIKLDAIESADLIIEFERTFYDYNICLQSHKDKTSIIQERDYVYLNDACK